MFTHADRLKTARVVRSETNLPTGRASFVQFERVEALFRQTMAPHIPTYDVNSVQGVEFDEWTYTEGPGCCIAFTQSVEINARLLLDAAVWAGVQVTDYVTQILADYDDKWDLDAPGVSAAGRKIFYPPGNNLSYLVNTDNVMRAFRTDSTWMLKPHPITSDQDVHQAEQAFGVTRVYPKNVSGIALLRDCDTVGYTVASELGLVGMLLGKPTTDFSVFQREHIGRYHPLYLAIRRHPAVPVSTIVNRFFNSPESGVIPVTVPDAEVITRVQAYMAATLALRDTYAHVIRDAERSVAPRPPTDG